MLKHALISITVASFCLCSSLFSLPTNCYQRYTVGNVNHVPPEINDIIKKNKGTLKKIIKVPEASREVEDVVVLTTDGRVYTLPNKESDEHLSFPEELNPDNTKIRIDQVLKSFNL